MKNQLTAKNLYKKYNKVVFKNTNFRVKSGHIYGLVAPNGAGKTTLMKCISGNASFSGKINYNGVRVGSHFNGQIVYSSSEPYFVDSTMRVVDHLHSITILKSINFKDAFAKFKRIPVLTHLENSICKELSTGQKKIFQLFLDLLSNPGVILLDEPLNGLDHEVRSYVISSLLSLAKQNKIIIISTHVFSDIENLTDKVFIIKDNFLNFYENEKDIAAIYSKFFSSLKSVKGISLL